jgi:hypothetical protein
MMIHPIPTKPTCASAWSDAVQHLIAVGGEAHNLLVDIDNPMHHTPLDRAVIVGLDDFLRARHANPVSTVANTIFPQDLYRRHGPKKFVDEYLRSYDAMRTRGWGRYFERMVRWRVDEDTITDQLQDLVDRLSQQLSAKQTFRSVYEMTLFDPSRDARRNRNRQCLSFLSFKLHPERGLMLTAMYRNHHYIARALGNFIGLGNLMAYIAERIGTTVGPLTCVSTHAELDTASACDDNSHDDACRGWTITEARRLVADLAALQSAPSAGSGSQLRITPPTRIPKAD